MDLVPRGRSRNRGVVGARGSISPYHRAVAAVLAGGVNAASNAAYSGGMNFAKRKAQEYFYPSKSQKKSSGTTNVLRIDGAGYGKTVKPKRRRRFTRAKKSLKKRVQALEKNRPIKDHASYGYMRAMKLTNGTANVRKVYGVPLTRKAEYASAALQLSLYDAGDSCVFNKVTGSFKITNCKTANLRVRYQFFMCSEDTPHTVITELKTWCLDRGYTFAAAETAAAGETATSSFVPMNQTLAVDELGTPMFTGSRSLQTWKPVGNIVDMVLGPGDEWDIKFNRKKQVVKRDVIDNAPSGTVYYENLDYFLVLQLGGTIGHDDTNNSMVAESPWGADCILHTKFYTEGIGGDGQKVGLFETLMTNTGVSSVVHVDNQVSAVEIADQ